MRPTDAYRAAIEAAAGEYGRVSKPRVREQFARYFPQERWNDRLYARVMRQRRNETGATADHFQRLRAMTLPDLDKAIAGIERRIGRTHGLPPSKKPKGEKLTRKQLLARLWQLQRERSHKLAIATGGREQAPLPGVVSAEAPPPDRTPSVEELGRMLRTANRVDPRAIAPDLIAFAADTPAEERRRIGIALARLLEPAHAAPPQNAPPIMQPWLARRNRAQQFVQAGGGA